MVVYICDDLKEDLIRLKHFLKRYAKENGFVIRVHLFDCAEDLLSAYCNVKTLPDIIFLDIYMKHLDGMETARKLRDEGKSVSIIFTTSSEEHAIEAFKLHAEGYLKKPYFYKDFCNALEPKKNELQKEMRKITVVSERTRKEILLKDIQFIEARNHAVYIQTERQEYKVGRSLREIGNEITIDESFVFCGNSYIVNLFAIEKIERSILFMKNGGQIQVPVRWVKKMREIVLQHQKCFN